MQAVQDIFVLWPSINVFAKDIGQLEDTVYRWARRGRIPPEHFNSVISAAKRRGHAITVDQLLGLNVPTKKRGWPLGKPRSVRRRKARPN